MPSQIGSKTTGARAANVSNTSEATPRKTTASNKLSIHSKTNVRNAFPARLSYSGLVVSGLCSCVSKSSRSLSSRNAYQRIHTGWTVLLQTTFTMQQLRQPPCCTLSSVTLLHLQALSGGSAEVALHIACKSQC